MRTLALLWLLGAAAPLPAQPHHNGQESFEEIKLKAERGDARAEFRLAKCYEQGHGVKPDAAEARKWLRKAAERGLAQAQVNLAMMYYRGRGLEKDYVQAYKWFSLAAAQGNEGAKQNLSTVETEMTPEQIVEAQRQVRRFKLAKAPGPGEAPLGQPAKP
jgi:uncharacterized protein